MKNMKSTVAKSLFVIALLCPAVFADGDQGSGGFADDGSTVITSESTMEGDQGSGGLTGDQGSGGATAMPCEEESYLDSVIDSIYEYFDSVS